MLIYCHGTKMVYNSDLIIRYSVDCGENNKDPNIFGKWLILAETESETYIMDYYESEETASMAMIEMVKSIVTSLNDIVCLPTEEDVSRNRKLFN